MTNTERFDKHTTEAGHRASDTFSERESGSRVHTYGMGSPNTSHPSGAKTPYKDTPSASSYTRGAAKDVTNEPSRASGGSSATSTNSRNTPPSTPKTANPKKKRGASFWVAIVVAIVCIVLACVLAFTMCGNSKGKRQGEAGQLEGKTQEEIQAELDRQVEEGMFNISIASYVEFADGKSEGELRIENVPGNKYLMSVEITLDSTGEKIYETALIEPNHHIQKDKLSVDLDPGTYEATATFFAYDPETEEEVGQAAAKITINVVG